jgi:hypothetical protein
MGDIRILGVACFYASFGTTFSVSKKGVYVWRRKEKSQRFFDCFVEHNFGNVFYYCKIKKAKK